MRVGGKHGKQVLEGGSKLWLECLTLTREKVSNISRYLATARKATGTWVQCLLNQHDRYLPLNILAATVADLTAEEEEKHVHHSGWAPCPSGGKWRRR